MTYYIKVKSKNDYERALKRISQAIKRKIELPSTSNIKIYRSYVTYDTIDTYAYLFPDLEDVHNLNIAPFIELLLSKELKYNLHTILRASKGSNLIKWYLRRTLH